MRLLYFKANNFGDELSPIIFNQLIPEAFSTVDDNIDFLGVGSIIGLDHVINARKNSKKIIFGSGLSPSYLKSKSRFSLNDKYEIFCVRGPMTSKLLNIDSSLAITDSAALLRDLTGRPQRQKKFNFSFMPHFESEKMYPWKLMCDELGIKYVSPYNNTLDTIEIIKSSKVVIAEAMHFAIVADTLRIPWIPIKIYPQIDAFKWNDWITSLAINTYNPTHLTPLYERRSNYGQVLNKRLNDKHSIELPSIIRRCIDSLSNRYIAAIYKYNVEKLKKIMTIHPNLSEDKIFNEKTDLLYEKIDSFRNKYLND